MNVGIIGCGKMGQALTTGAIHSGALKPDQLFLYDPHTPSAEALQNDAGGSILNSLDTLVSHCEAMLICVKPAQVSEVLAIIAQKDTSALALSIAAGITLEKMEMVAGKARIIRIMPNTPCLVATGASAYSPGTSATHEDTLFTEKLLSSVGIVERVPESLMDVVTGLSGSGPAYLYTVIESLVEGAISEELPPDQALRLATQTVLGAAMMVRESNITPAELRARVTSPNGTTVAGLAALEAGDFSNTIQAAVKAATARSRELGAQ